MKRTLSLLLALVMVVSMIPAVFAETEKPGIDFEEEMLVLGEEERPEPAEIGKEYTTTLDEHYYTITPDVAGNLQFTTEVTVEGVEAVDGVYAVNAGETYTVIVAAGTGTTWSAAYAVEEVEAHLDAVIAVQGTETETEDTVTITISDEVKWYRGEETAEGYQIGFKLSVPEGVQAADVTVLDWENQTVNLADALVDGIGAFWVDLKATESRTFTYKVDWNSDGTYELNIVLDATAATLEKDVFYGSSMTLGNDLVMNFILMKSKLTQGVSNYYIKVTKDGEETTIIPDEWLDKPSYYQISYYGLTAKQMTTEIKVDLYFTNGTDTKDDDVAQGAPKFDSIETYAHKALDSASLTDDVKTVAVDMLIYGAASQVQFDYNEDKPATRYLTDEDWARATTEFDAPKDTRDPLNRTDKYYGSSISLENSIEFNQYFSNISNPEGMYCVVEFTHYNGRVEEPIRIDYAANSEFFKKAANKIYMIKVKAVLLADISEVVTFTMYNADGSVHAVVTENVESYCARGGGDMFMAVYKFALSARAYLLNKQ